MAGDGCVCFAFAHISNNSSSHHDLPAPSLPRPHSAPALPDDDAVLALLRSSAVSVYLPRAIVKELLVTARFDVIQRAIALLDDPAVLAGDGFSHSRAAIKHYLASRRDGEPVASPVTTLVLDEALAIVVSNHLLRGWLDECRVSKTKEWEAAERRWRAWAEGEGQRAEEVQ